MELALAGFAFASAGQSSFISRSAPPVPCHFMLVLKHTNSYRAVSMAKALTQSQIATPIAETAGITQKQATQILEAIVALA